MRAHVRFAFAAALVAAAALPASAQSSPNAAAAAPVAAPGLGTDLMNDINQVERKILALARAIPADKYDWRPMAGVKSVREALLHVAADNYLLPATIGHAADSASGIKRDDYKAAQAFEARGMSREATIAELERSFIYLKKTLGATTTAKFAEDAPLFGQKFTGQQAWILTTTHLHEHLGQLIAYARSNGVVPPWSQGG